MERTSDSRSDRAGAWQNNNFFIYGAIIVGALAIALDFASVDLALPAIEDRFALDLDSVQWVINGYVLAFSVLLVAGGRMADAYGRRRIFLIGMACAAVGDANRGFALGLIFGTCSLGNAAGTGRRRSAHPTALLALGAVGQRADGALFHADRDLESSAGRVAGERPRNDNPGMVALVGGLVALMLVVYQAQAWSWMSPKTLGLSTMAIALPGMFPLIERRSAAALIPPDLMRNREILTLCLCALVICQLFFCRAPLLHAIRDEVPRRRSDVGRRARVQFMLSYGVVSYFGDPLIAWLGTRRLLVVGMACAIAASILLGIYGPGAEWLVFNGSLVLLGVGVGAVIPTVSSRGFWVKLIAEDCRSCCGSAPRWWRSRWGSFCAACPGVATEVRRTDCGVAASKSVRRGFGK
ncbi:MAG: MFS transporter [Terrimicrobiaceae bacterium]|nr:MFS transporter [Terrimicrobiaceae bacterium]